MSISKKRLEELASRDAGTIDYSEIPELGPDFWKNARLVMPGEGKKQLTVRFDTDVVEWFKSQGKGYQTRMNAVLRSFMEANR